MNIPSPAEIIAEIDTITTMKPTVRKESIFGDNHHDAIDAQIQVLQRLMNEDQVDKRFGNSEDNVRNAALQAVQWLEGGDSIDNPRPSDEWQELVGK